MNAYKELINRLRDCPTQADIITDNIFAVVDYADTKASADALEYLVGYVAKCEKECGDAEKYIEQLVKDNDVLTKARDEYKTMSMWQAEQLGATLGDLNRLRSERDEANATVERLTHQLEVTPPKTQTPPEVRTIYGYPLEQVILAAELMYKRGISVERLNTMAENFAFAYEIVAEEHEKMLERVFNEFCYGRPESE